MKSLTLFVVDLHSTFCLVAAAAEPKPVVAIIGTGDMGDSLGPRFTELGYTIVYSSREPGGDKAQALLKQTGPNASVTTQREAAQAGDIVILVVPWPAMETVAQNLGSLDDKISIDISFPHEQCEDGYYVPIICPTCPRCRALPGTVRELASRAFLV